MELELKRLIPAGVKPWEGRAGAGRAREGGCLGAAGSLVPLWGSPLFSMYLVSWCAWSTGTPWISTRTRGSMMAPSLLLATLGSCCPLITCRKGYGPSELGSS